MAFVLTMELLGYKGKVVSSGNHSWSAFWVTFINKEGQKQLIEMEVDNTFNGMQGNPLATESNFTAWQKDIEDRKLPRWYNQKAHSLSEKEKVKNLIVSEPVAARIEKQVLAFF